MSWLIANRPLTFLVGIFIMVFNAQAYDFKSKNDWLARCDLNRDNTVNKPDKRKFRKLCSTALAGNVCDQNEDGKSNKLRDKRIFWLRCKTASIAPKPDALPSAVVLRSRVVSMTPSTMTYTVDLHLADLYSDSVASLNINDVESASGKTLNSKPGILFGYQPVSASCGTPGDKGAYSAMMVLDRSGSMASNDPQNITLTAAESFARNLGAGDTMSLMAFPEDQSANRPYQCTVYGTGFDAVSNGWIASIKTLADANGGTPLYDCALQSLNYTLSKTPGQSNRAVLLFTDGDDTESISTVDDVIAKSIATSIPIFPIALDSANSLALGEVAFKTGGGLIFASDVRQLITAYSTLGGVLRGTRPICTLTMNEYMQQGKLTNGGSSLRYVKITVGEEVVFIPVYLPVYWDQ